MPWYVKFVIALSVAICLAWIVVVVCDFLC